MTPQGHVLHSVSGPVSAAVLLAEAKWASDVYARMKKLAGPAQGPFVASMHQEASLVSVSKQDKKVHDLYSWQPKPHLKLVYKQIFEDILGQKVSQAGPRLAQAAVRLQRAKELDWPILFVMHKGDHWSEPTLSPDTETLLKNFIVIKMPIKEGPALSQLTMQPPLEARGNQYPLMAITSSDCKPLMPTISGWDETALSYALAGAWAGQLEKHPPSSIGVLVRAQRLMRRINNAAADRVRDVTVRVQKQAKDAREEKLREKRLAATELASESKSDIRLEAFCLGG